MPIIATAGHVDHGKSTLVQALTGRDPDRWAEEKQRGLTIDLGFAWADIGGHHIGFVDVPGHERFIKNMLAGVGAVDVALFVVAADEGWMPQTEEHLAVLDALDVRHGVVALTRTDLVDDELAELAAAEVEDRTAGTTLEGWPIVTVSAVTGAGIDALRSALADALAAAGPPRDIGRPRMWIDRAFVVGGAGIVVTGTLVDGPLRRGDTVALWPGGGSARVRTIQSHEMEVEAVPPGSRAALNLAGTDRSNVPRGTMLGTPAAFRSTQRLLVRLSPVRAWPEAVTDRGAYHLHAGTGHWPVRLRLLGAKQLTVPTPALMTIDTPVPLRMGDRFVIREVGRRVVVSGGLVLDPHPLRGTPDASAAATLERAMTETADERARALLEVRGLTSLAALDVDTGGGKVAGGVIVGDTVMTPDQAAATRRRLVALTADFHAAHPMRPGIPTATLASGASVASDVLDALVAAPDSGLVAEGATVRRTNFSLAWTPAHEAAWEEARRRLTAGALAVPRLSSLELDPEHQHARIRAGELIVVGDDVAYLPEQVEEIFARLADLGDGFTVGQFRDALGITRRHAVPLLEWLDAQGWTSRRGDVRTLRRRPT